MSVPLIMWNPPWTLSLTAPFAVFSYTTGQFLWLLFHVALILVSVQQLWCIYGGADHAISICLGTGGHLRSNDLCSNYWPD